ncbi:MAG: GumC family protein [Roseibium sp.]
MIEVSDIPEILRRKMAWIVLATIMVIGLALVYLALKSPVYRTETELLIQPQNAEFIAGNPVSSNEPGSPTLDINSQTYVILSAPVLNQVANLLDLDNSPEFNRPRLLNRILGVPLTESRSSSDIRNRTLARLREVVQVYRLGKSFVFQIQVSLSDPILAATIANETANAYIELNRENRNNALIQASTTLGKQAAQLISKVEEAEAAVVAYRAKQGLISTQGGLVVDQQIESLNTQITNARVELERARAIEELVAQLTLTAVRTGAVPQSVSTTVLSSLRVQYATITQQVAEATTTLGSNHPKLRELQSQLASTEKLIASELQRIKSNVRSQFEQAKATLIAIEQQLAGLQSQNSTQGQALIELRRLQSEADANRTVYEAFRNKSRELGELPEIDLNKTRILSEAPVPTSESGPHDIVVLGAAAVFGFVLSATSAVGLSIITGQISSERTLVNRTGIPIIANISAGNSAPAERFSVASLFGKKWKNTRNQSTFAHTRVAYTLRQAFADQRPANVLVLSVGNPSDTSGFVRKIAEELHDMGEEVLFAHTSTNNNSLPAANVPSSLRNPNARVGVLSNLATQLTPHGQTPNQNITAEQNARSGGLSSFLSVEQIDPRRKYSSSGTLDSNGEDFLIVDAGNADTSPMLPVLLRHCDGILLMTAMRSTRTADIERTIAYLDPWYDRIIGNVVV